MSTPPQLPHKRWFMWRDVSDISASEDDAAGLLGSEEHPDHLHHGEDDDGVPLDYSESEDDLNLASPVPQQEALYATGSSHFLQRQNSRSSRVVRFQSTRDSKIATYDEEMPPSLPETPSPETPPRIRDRKARKPKSKPSTDPNQPSSPSKKVWNAVSNLALAVHRSPKSSTRRTGASSGGGNKRVSSTREYPHRARTPDSSDSTAVVHTKDVVEPATHPRRDRASSTGGGEHTPLLQQPHSSKPRRIEDYGPFHTKEISKRRSVDSSTGMPSNHFKARKQRLERKMIQVACAFLRDCEKNRRPSLPPELSSITDTLLSMGRWKYSFFWCTLVNLAVVAMFLSCSFESSHNQLYAHVLHIYAIVIFVLDMAMGSELRKHQQLHMQHDPMLQLRESRLEQWTMLLAGLIFLLTLEIALSVGTERRGLWSSALKPIALFYVSTQAKNALEALNRISRIVMRVLVMEMFVILSFAAVACRLYINFDSFHDLSTAFLSLFQLSTTVVNPSVWMPMYNASPYSAFFFVFFVTTSVFYLHSLVLSVVFQTYVHASTEIHERNMTDREDAIRLAFLALKNIDSQEESEEATVEIIRMDSVRKTLRLLRPHYNSMKINALIEIVDPSSQTVIDYPSFRTKIREALNASVRTARTPTTFSVAVELVSATVAIVNFVYVILFTSAFHADWFDVITVPAGTIITCLGLLELSVRLNPWHVLHFTPITRLNTIFDGMAAIAAAISLHGLFSYWTGAPLGLELFLTGRAVDMIRVMRFFPIFRDVVRRSGDVFPALAGPVALVFSAIHLYTYVGIALWGGAITVGAHAGQITPLYDLNNFNSYSEGMVTMFQVLVVNDWHAIAETFLYASRCASPYIVYPFFVSGNLIGVSILLNCLTAFFVGAFVTKRSDDFDEDSEEVTTVRPRPTDFGILHSERNFRRTSSQRNIREMRDRDDDIEEFSTTSSEDLQEFNVYEREGYDKIMQTVAGIGGDGADYAREVCDFLEIFEGLAAGRRRVGFMVCCQQTLSRFGNRRFQSIARSYIDESALHMVVSDMHAELLALAGKHINRSLIREFVHLREPDKVLELSASLIRDHPAVTLFVSDVMLKGEA